MYNFIKDNDFDRLKEIIEQKKILGAANIFFDFYDHDEEIVNLAGEHKVSLSILNPVLLCLKYKSTLCLRYILDAFGLRPSIKTVDIIVRKVHGEYPFR